MEIDILYIEDKIPGMFYGGDEHVHNWTVEVELSEQEQSLLISQKEKYQEMICSNSITPETFIRKHCAEILTSIKERITKEITEEREYEWNLKDDFFCSHYSELDEAYNFTVDYLKTNCYRDDLTEDDCFRIVKLISEEYFYKIKGFSPNRISKEDLVFARNCLKMFKSVVSTWLRQVEQGLERTFSGEVLINDDFIIREIAKTYF